MRLRRVREPGGHGEQNRRDNNCSNEEPAYWQEYKREYKHCHYQRGEVAIHLRAAFPAALPSHHRCHIYLDTYTEGCQAGPQE